MAKTEILLAARKCLICHTTIPLNRGVTTGYLFMSDGTKNVNHFLFCSKECADKFLGLYGNVIFQNPTAKEVFKNRHPQLWLRIKYKPSLFLEATA